METIIIIFVNWFVASALTMCIMPFWCNKEIRQQREHIEGLKVELSESKERERIATKIITDKRKEIDAINAKWETIEKGYQNKIKELNKQLKK